jgi:hypothetical protein
MSGNVLIIQVSWFIWPSWNYCIYMWMVLQEQFQPSSDNCLPLQASFSTPISSMLHNQCSWVAWPGW